MVTSSGTVRGSSAVAAGAGTQNRAPVSAEWRYSVSRRPAACSLAQCATSPRKHAGSARAARKAGQARAVSASSSSCWRKICFREVFYFDAEFVKTITWSSARPLKEGPRVCNSGTRQRSSGETPVGMGTCFEVQLPAASVVMT